MQTKSKKLSKGHINWFKIYFQLSFIGIKLGRGTQLSPFKTVVRVAEILSPLKEEQLSTGLFKK